MTRERERDDEREREREREREGDDDGDRGYKRRARGYETGKSHKRIPEGLRKHKQEIRGR